MTEQGACELAHEYIRDREHHTFSFDPLRIPKNGLYILFENGEDGHHGPRIVRIGTHTGQNQLRSRLNQHFLNEKKDRSIFRKNIGRSILAKRNDSYLPIWEMDFTTRAARLSLPSEFDRDHQDLIEKEVTTYMHNAFSFVVVEVPDKADRLKIESGLVSLVSRCTECGPSSNWLGLHSPKDRIRTSGLWQVNELYKTPLTIDETERLPGKN